MKFNFNKWATLITIMILLLTTFVSAIAYNVSLRNDVDINEIHIKECKESSNLINELNNNQDNRISIIETHYEHIKESLDRIENKIEVKNEI